MHTGSSRSDHPCRACGACCASYQVSFYWAEADAHGVPPEMAVPVGRLRLAMAGTERAAPRCDALLGILGGFTTCSIYDTRPSPCREFAAAYEHGEPNEACDRARVRHGLPVLTAASWVVPPEKPRRRPRAA